MLVRLAPWLIAGLSLVLGLLFPWLKTPLIIGLSYGFAALGVGILIRAGQVSFGHAGFTCLSGYALVAISRMWPQIDGVVLLAVGGVCRPVERGDRGPVHGALPRHLLRHAEPGAVDGALCRAGQVLQLHRGHRRHATRNGLHSSAKCWSAPTTKPCCWC